MTRDCRRGGKQKKGGVKDVESGSEDEENINAETSISSEGQNVKDVVQNSDMDEDEDDDFAQSNMAAAESMQWKPTDDSGEDEDVTQASSMLQNGTDNDMGMNSGSLDDSININQSESDVVLNKNDNFQAEKALAKFNHTFPRKPDFLDMCCAGDPLEVEKHLEYPVNLEKSKQSTKL